MPFLVSFFLLFSPIASALETSFGGDFTYENFIYGDQLPQPTRTYDHILHLRPQLDLTFNKISAMHFKPLLRMNTSTQESPEKLFLNVQEAYWEIRKDAFRVRMGQNTYHWGILDGYSTMDVVNGRVLFNPLFSEKRGAPTVDLQYEGEKIKLQGLYIPAQARTLFPSADSRWLPRELLVNVSSPSETVILPSTFNYYYPGYVELDHALDHNYGARLSGRMGDFDAALMHFEGSSITPQVRATFTADLVSFDPRILQGRSDIGIMPLYFRQRSTGLSLSWAPSDIVLKAESTYISSISRDSTIPAWSWQNALGVEMPVYIGETSITLIAQVYRGENKDPIDNLLSSSTRLFDNASLLAARVSFATDTNLLLSAVVDFASGDNYIHCRLDHKLSQSLRAEISVDILEGGPDSMIGTYDKNDRASLKISYLW